MGPPNVDALERRSRLHLPYLLFTRPSFYPSYTNLWRHLELNGKPLP